MSVIFYKNDKRYKRFPCGVRKMCQVETCPRTASGDFCIKHKPVVINPDQRQCHRCYKVKIDTEFIVDDTEYTHCTYCREIIRLGSLRRHQKRREYLLQLKLDKGGQCVDCHTIDLEILEFDHVYGDKIAPVRRISNFEGMKVEADKTELRCVNCHMKKIENISERIEITEDNERIQYSRAYRERNRDYVDEIKMKSGGCEECGWFDEKYLQVLHFDHVNGSTKDHNISDLVRHGRALDIIMDEIKKCRVLCANCHRKRTLRQFDYPIVGMIEQLNEINV